MHGRPEPINADSSLMRGRRIEYVLIGLSLAWVALLVMLPHLGTSRSAFGFTILLVCVNLATTLHRLFSEGRILVGLSLIQVALFCALSFQLFQVAGREHYRAAANATWRDWGVFTGVHVLKAADVLDGIEAYDVDLLRIEHRSVWAGLLLVWLHLTVDLFLIGILIRWLVRSTRATSAIGENRRRFAWFTAISFRRLALVLVLLTLSCTVGVALVQAWHWQDCVLWPLDNALRTVDIGDMFQVFHWRLHDVPMGLGMATLAIAFRVAIAIYVVDVVRWIRLRTIGARGQSTAELIDMLDTGDARAKELSIDRLAAFGQAAIPDLIDALDSGSPAIRAGAADALARIGELAVPSLVELLSQRGGGAARQHAVDALAQVGERAVPALVQSLTGPAALGQLDALARIGTPAIPELIEALGDERRRHYAGLVLCEIGDDALKEVVAALASPEPSVRTGAAVELAKFGQAAVPRWQAALHDDRPQVRMATAHAIGALGEKATEIAPQLIEAYEAESSNDIRREFAAAIARVRATVPEGLSALAEAADHPDRRIRCEAAKTLAQIGPAARSAAPALLRMLEEYDSHANRASAEALIAIQPDADSIVEQLAAILERNRAYDKSAVLRVLARYGASARSAIPAVVKLVQEGSSHIRRSGMETLDALDDGCNEITLALLSALKDEDKHVVAQAGSYLRKRSLPTDFVVPDLLAILADTKSTHTSVREATELLGNLSEEHHERIVNDVMRLLRSEQQSVRLNATNVLVKMQLSAVPNLVESLHDEFPQVRALSAWALGEIGPAAQTALGTLAETREDDDESVRRAASNAILKIEGRDQAG